ncbi:MAG: ribonuclease R [Phycisphaerae bacterium]|nr:ribonuclease R [Phycisphaerae bacterium]MCZ2398338.1 ribonuclease R [Phycisphaerae bacterium]
MTALPPPWQAEIIQHIADHPDRPLKARALARELNVPAEQYPAFRDAVRGLVADGVLALGAGRTLTLPERGGAVVGVFRANRRGFGFIECPGRPDLYVPRGRTHGAFENDRVEARLVRGRRSQEPHAEITRIIERAPLRWVGVLERHGDHWYVQPQGRAPAPRVRIDDPTAKNARPGDLVLVEPLEHTLAHHVVRGVIAERLGDPSQTQVTILGVVRRHGIPDVFPPEVRGAAQRAAADFDPAQTDGREDLRDLLTITIDPPDARDFDDAVSVEPLGGGHTRLGVHIADVAHFVPLGGPVDAEAQRRGNSVYFPGYVVPMLPETLSNGVCSLQPGQVRFTKSAFITYDAEARVVETRLVNSLIRSNARLTYEQASAALEGWTEGLARPVVALLERAARLARRIRQRRLAAGMLVLTLPEVALRLDDDGRVVDAGPADTSFSHTLIEMFMVEANEAVCRTFAELGLPHLRRIHPPPSPDAIARLVQLAGGIGLRLPRTLDRAALQAVLDQTRGKPEEPALNLLLLRSLAQAAYSPLPEGHYALASEHYCHFTSPIRRYPDLVVHRLFDHVLRAPRRRRAPPPPEQDLVALGRHTSATERRAQDAERELRQLLLLSFMQGKLGEELEGLITGVSSFGVFVQVRPYLAEGLIHLSELPRDEWVYDERFAQLRGSRSGRVIAIGQIVRVRVAAVDIQRQEMSLAPAGSVGATGTAAPRGEPSRPRRPRSGARASSARSCRADQRAPTRRARRRRGR